MTELVVIGLLLSGSLAAFFTPPLLLQISLEDPQTTETALISIIATQLVVQLCVYGHLYFHNKAKYKVQEVYM